MISASTSSRDASRPAPRGSRAGRRLYTRVSHVNGRYGVCRQGVVGKGACLGGERRPVVQGPTCRVMCEITGCFMAPVDLLTREESSRVARARPSQTAPRTSQGHAQTDRQRDQTDSPERAASLERRTEAYRIHMSSTKTRTYTRTPFNMKK